MSLEGRGRNNTLDEKPAFPWISGAVLVASNLVPLWFVLFRGCDVYYVLVLFWVENVLVGVFNVVRMAWCTNEVADPDPSVREQLDGFEAGGASAGGKVRRAALIPFFILHYGMFTFIHGIFVVGAIPEMLGIRGLLDLNPSQVGIASLALAASHGVSFFANYLGRQEYRKTTVQAVMVRPYGRVFALHVTIVLGGILVSAMGGSIWMLVLLLGLKIVFDLSLHIRERKKLSGSLPIETPTRGKRKSVIVPPSGTGPHARHIVPAVLLGLFGVFLVTISVKGFRDYDDLDNWVETPCKIVRVEQGKPDAGEEPYSRIWYAYTYEGRAYETDDIAFGPPYVDYEMLRRSGDEWQEGDTGTCYVNPRKPSMAFMYLREDAEQYMRKHTWGLIVCGAVSILLGACFIAYGFLRRFLSVLN